MNTKGLVGTTNKQEMNPGRKTSSHLRQFIKHMPRCSAQVSKGLGSSTSGSATCRSQKPGKGGGEPTTGGKHMRWVLRSWCNLHHGSRIRWVLRSWCNLHHGSKISPEILRGKKLGIINRASAEDVGDKNYIIVFPTFPRSFSNLVVARVSHLKNHLSSAQRTGEKSHILGLLKTTVKIFTIFWFSLSGPGFIFNDLQVHPFPILFCSRLDYIPILFT